MKKSTSILSRFVRVTTGQDLIEYALMAGFVAIAAGAIMPGVAEDIDKIFAKISHSFCVADAGNNVGAKAVCNSDLANRYRRYEKGGGR